MATSPLPITAAIEQRPSSDEWRLEFVGDFTRGLDTSKRGRGIDQGSLITADNVRISKNAVVVDLGYKQFNQNTIVGAPRLGFEYTRPDGTKSLLLLTNSRLYVWNDTVQEFQHVPGTNLTTATIFRPAGTNVVNVADPSGFVAGDIIVVQLDSGRHHVTTVWFITGDGITLNDNLPEDVSPGNAVLEPKFLQGSDDIQPSVVAWAATGRVYFANGVNAPFYYDGTQALDIQGLPVNTVARVVAVHQNHLILLNTIEGGTNYPHRQRWSEPGSDSDWNTNVNYIDHVGSNDHITAAELLEAYLIIYKERTIIRQEYLGSPGQTWNFTTVITGEGVLGEQHVVNLGDEHIFIGHANIYRYRGGFDLLPIGDRIFDKVFSVSEGELNRSKAHRMFAAYVEALNELWFFYHHSDTTYPQRMLRLNRAVGAWTVRNFAFEVSGVGFFSSENVAGETWSESIGTWEEDVGPWFGTSVQSESPSVLLFNGPSRKIYEYDFVTTNDDGNSIGYEVATKDFFTPNRNFRFDRYDFVLKGSSIKIDASVDEGQSYKVLGTVSPGAGFKRVRLYKQLVGQTLRFRFIGSADFGLEELSFAYKQESLW